MPELPEVEVSAQVAKRALKDRVITGVSLKSCKLFRSPKRSIISLPSTRTHTVSDIDQLERLLHKATASRQVTIRHGKLMACLLETDEGYPLCLFARLGMTGKFVLSRPELPPRSGVKMSLSLSDIGTHEPVVRLDFVNTRMFGAVWGVYIDEYMTLDDRVKRLKKLFTKEVKASAMGPDAYELCQTPQRWVKYLRHQAGNRQLKTALLDQKLLAGVGNIYAVEGLFAAQAHPLSRVRDLSDQQLANMAEGISVAMRATLDRSQDKDEVVYGSAQGEKSPFAVYGRDGLPCVSCEHPLALLRVGGRATVFCPQCQPNDHL